MTPADYRAALVELGLTQIAAGPILAVSRRTAQSYAADGPAGPAARLIDVLRAMPPEAREAWFTAWRQPGMERGSHAGHRISPDAFRRFVAHCENPPDASPALKALIAQSRERRGR